MFLAIDIGNTHSVFAFYQGDDLKAIWRLQTDAKRSADEYSALLWPLAIKDSVDFNAVSSVLISSVVPDVGTALRDLAKKLFPCDVIELSHAMMPNLEIKLPRPDQVGDDRLINALAVNHYYKAPAIVIDFGTATTFDVVDHTGAFIGGVIAPGLNLSLDALYAAAAKLPKISVRKPERAIGNDTVSAMSSGMYWGYVSLVEGMVRRIKSEMSFDGKVTVIATGGLASLMAEGLEGVIDTVDTDLTLKGLKKIYDLQQGNVKQLHDVM